MADLSDAVNTVVAQVAQAIYPNGTALPSVTGLPTLVYAGAPAAAQLDADLAGFSNGQGGRIHVSVMPGDTETVTTRFSPDWQQLSVSTPSIALVASGQSVTVSGAGQSFAQNATVFVNGLPYQYSVQPTDTAASVATALAALIGAVVPGVSSAGAVLNLPASARLGAVHVGSSGTMFRELGRQARVVQITVWADTPANRDATAKAIDVVLRGIPYLTMPDGLGARMQYSGTQQQDVLQKANLYRRDLNYCVEYATTVVQSAVQVSQAAMTLTPASSGVGAMQYQ